MSRLAGLVLNAAGVWLLWFGSISYQTTEKLLDLGPIHATHEVEHKILETPPWVGAGFVAVGTALLLAASFKRSKS